MVQLSASEHGRHYERSTIAFVSRSSSRTAGCCMECVYRTPSVRHGGLNLNQRVTETCIGQSSVERTVLPHHSTVTTCQGSSRLSGAAELSFLHYWPILRRTSSMKPLTRDRTAACMCKAITSNIQCNLFSSPFPHTTHYCQSHAYCERKRVAPITSRGKCVLQIV